LSRRRLILGITGIVIMDESLAIEYGACYSCR